jgi:anti-anti-sigma regulatory factor
MSAAPVLLSETPDPREFHGVLCAALSAGGDVVVDAAEVRRLSAACIQLFAAAHKELSAAGRRLVVRNPSFPFGLAFEALGFEGERELFTVEYA